MISFHKILADGFFVFAFMAIFGAMIGWLDSDIWLASTQWILVGIFLMLVAIYVKLSAKEDETIMKKYNKNSKK
jgi:hypothetical protein